MRGPTAHAGNFLQRDAGPIEEGHLQIERRKIHPRHHRLKQFGEIQFRDPVIDETPHCGPTAILNQQPLFECVASLQRNAGDTPFSVAAAPHLALEGFFLAATRQGPQLEIKKVVSGNAGLAKLH